MTIWKRLSDTYRVAQARSALKSATADTRKHAIESLARIGNRAALRAVVGAAGDRSSRNQEMVLKLLCEAKDPSLVVELEQGLGQGTPRARVIIAQVLGLRARTDEANRSSLYAMIAAAFSKETDKDAAFGMALALQNSDDARAVDELIRALSSGAAGRRVAAALALGMNGDERAALPLMSALSDHHIEVVEAATGALAAFADSRAVDAMLTRAKTLDTDSYLRLAPKFADAIRRMKEETERVTLLLAAMEKEPRPSPDLVQLMERNPFGDLARSLMCSQRVRILVTMALADCRTDPRAAQRLTELREDPDPAIREAAKGIARR